MKNVDWLAWVFVLGGVALVLAEGGGWGLALLAIGYGLLKHGPNTDAQDAARYKFLREQGVLSPSASGRGNALDEEVDRAMEWII